ncbi:PEP-CTERM sorting domain-containing protein [Paucibacter sp. TC2R-5]|uniref:PEP-CTERM sorting domain-containing protein n=1 Tax=Paucibacter sp. TC2R-5 TaxID=2893555 RepID=UPI0021E391E5|nr:PEP-CTERM sorting domain-containing protein [Paucibacter sp. TC2R-5]MCV2361246.1 PEP-CTERM sorting domain-containing protein [Paucibacter sp. TC2R-5]
MSVFSRALVAVTASLLIAPFAAEAAPQTYAIKFNVTEGSLAPTAGTFTYDAGVGFSAFTLVWDGVTFDLTASSNNPRLSSKRGVISVGTAADSFALLSNTLHQPRGYTGWSADYYAPNREFGFMSRAGGPEVNRSFVYFSEVALIPHAYPFDYYSIGEFSIAAVPEPQSYAMLLAGLGLMGLVARGRSSK